MYNDYKPNKLSLLELILKAIIVSENFTLFFFYDSFNKLAILPASFVKNRTKAIVPHHIVISSTSLIISRTIVGLQAFFWSKEVLLLVFFAF